MLHRAFFQRTGDRIGYFAFIKAPGVLGKVTLQLFHNQWKMIFIDCCSTSQRTSGNDPNTIRIALACPRIFDYPQYMTSHNRFFLVLHSQSSFVPGFTARGEYDEKENHDTIEIALYHHSGTPCITAPAIQTRVNRCPVFRNSTLAILRSSAHAPVNSSAYLSLPALYKKAANACTPASDATLDTCSGIGDRFPQGNVCQHEPCCS